MNFIELESKQKLRGGYYTPLDIAEFITNWVSEINPKQILEPSCGDGAFLKAMHKSIKNNDLDITRLLGIEFDSEEFDKSKDLANTLNPQFTISNNDFLDWSISNLENGSIFDAVIGNPPFIRYQYLPDFMQDEASQIFNYLNIKFTKHTNAWVPFVLASIHFLRPGGRLGMVLPSEILHVMYAQSIRSYIGDNCKYSMIFDPEDLWFEGTLQGAVILLIEKKISINDKSQGLGIKKIKGRDFLSRKASSYYNEMLFRNGDTIRGKWTYALLNDEEFSLVTKLKQNKKIHKFSEIAKVDVGIVTGANKFFLVTDKVVSDYDLKQFSSPMFGRSDQCPGIKYDNKQHVDNSKNEKPNNFLYFDVDSIDSLNDKQKEYIMLGESQDFHKRYKCRIRKPWFKVPSVYHTETGLMKRCHNFPKLILNEKKALTTDTAYRITFKNHDFSNKDFVYSFINSLTALFAELEGRHYGGGVLELVPSEIEKLFVPLIKVADSDINDLNQAIKSNNSEDILATQSNKVLKSCGLDNNEIKIINNAWLKLKNRRQRKS